MTDNKAPLALPLEIEDSSTGCEQMFSIYESGWTDYADWIARVDTKEKAEYLQIAVNEHADLKAQVERQRKFIGKVFDKALEYVAIDSCDVQEWGVEFGLLKEVVATEDDVDEYSDYEVGDTIYKPIEEEMNNG